jgi:hypothetical protein
MGMLQVEPMAFIPSTDAIASTIASAPLQAYRETDYHVDADPPFTLRVGRPCPELVLAHRRHRVECSAFLTACNPFSRMLDDAENAQRLQALRDELSRRSLAFDEGAGQHPNNGWPPEPSVLVYGLELQAARTLGQRFEQNALLWCGSDGVPGLVVLR